MCKNIQTKLHFMHLPPQSEDTRIFVFLWNDSRIFYVNLQYNYTNFTKLRASPGYVFVQSLINI